MLLKDVISDPRTNKDRQAFNVRPNVSEFIAERNPFFRQLRFEVGLRLRFRFSETNDHLGGARQTGVA